MQSTASLLLNIHPYASSALDLLHLVVGLRPAILRDKCKYCALVLICKRLLIGRINWMKLRFQDLPEA